MERRLISLTGAAEHRRPPKKRTSMAAEISFRCPVCDKTFASEKYVRMHLGIHRQMAPDIQETQYDFIAGGHADVAGKPGVWECAVCGKYFLQASYYRNHMRTHSEERPFVCDLCSIGFKERYHLKKHHLFKHSKEMNEQCRKCGKRFKDSTAVRAHERIHSDARPFACTRCGKAFKTSECLWHHDHRSKACTAPVQRQRGEGTICGSQAERRRSAGVAQTEIGVSELSQLLTVRSSRLTGQLNFRCESQNQMIARGGKNVGFRFSSSSLSSSTSNESYDLRISADDGRKSEGNSEEKLEEEMTEWGFSASSSTSGYSVCDEAGKTSPLAAFHSSSSCAIANRWLEKSSSEEHRKNITGRIACVRCGKQFASARAFEKHARMHNELRPHRCTICDVGFKLKVHLKKHNLYRHNTDYPCKCSVCGKGFKDTSAVRLHERIHSNERPFLCPCGKAFKTRENLWGHRHRLKHNTERHTTVDSSQPNGTQSDPIKSFPHKTSRSPPDATQSGTLCHKFSFNCPGSGNAHPSPDYHGLDVARDFVKTETTMGACNSRAENSNRIDCYGKSRCWTRDVERDEMKVAPDQLMTTASVNGHDDHLFMMPASLQSSDEQRRWSGSCDVVRNSLPSFETLISALRSCVGNWQETGALSPLPPNGGTVDLTHDRKVLGTKATRQPSTCAAATPEVLVETTRKGACGRRALIQRFMQSQELCVHGTADFGSPYRHSHSLNTESDDQEGKYCNNILSVTWQHFQQLE